MLPPTHPIFTLTHTCGDVHQSPADLFGHCRWFSFSESLLAPRRSQMLAAVLLQVGRAGALAGHHVHLVRRRHVSGRRHPVCPWSDL